MRRFRRWLHRLRFQAWLLGAGDVDGFEARAHVLGRMRRGLLGVQPKPRRPVRWGEY